MQLIFSPLCLFYFVIPLKQIFYASLIKNSLSEKFKPPLWSQAGSSRNVCGLWNSWDLCPETADTESTLSLTVFPFSAAV